MEAIKHRLAKGLSPTEIARELGISRGTVYKAHTSRTCICEHLEERSVNDPGVACEVDLDWHIDFEGRTA